MRGWLTYNVEISLPKISAEGDRIRAADCFHAGQHNEDGSSLSQNWIACWGSGYFATGRLMATVCTRLEPNPGFVARRFKKLLMSNPAPISSNSATAN